eukprot:4896303-Pleurochrysis_carterae.AAC.1
MGQRRTGRTRNGEAKEIMCFATGGRPAPCRKLASRRGICVGDYRSRAWRIRVARGSRRPLPPVVRPA